VYNETVHLVKRGVGWDVISDRVAERHPREEHDSPRRCESTRRDKNYYEYDDFGLPSHTKDGPYPLRANYQKGYNLSLKDDEVMFRLNPVVQIALNVP
jgi:hypothetical protein